MEKTFKISVAYDGTEYAGWQLQPNQPTIQGAIEGALARIAGRRVVVDGASRTDSGVHARGQVACFRWDMAIPVDRIPHALNASLPWDIRILTCVEAPGFEARRDSKGKTYSYTVDRSPIPDPLMRRFAVHVPDRIDRELIVSATERLRGEIDLSCFTPAESLALLGARGGTRMITAAEWKLDGDIWRFLITADGFLRHSVRAIVGALLEVGRGQITVDDLMAAVRARSRVDLRSPTMAAKGLCLESVRY